MRDSIKMTMTMGLLAMISAALLTGVEAWTSPIIEANLQQVFMEKVEQYLPEADNLEIITGEEEYPEIQAVYGPDESLLGFMIENTAGGYEGDILYYTIVDEDGYIKGVEIIDHTETPGIGAEIEREDFRKQFTGKHYTDSFAAGEEIDIISGATVSSQSLIASVRLTMEELGQTGYLEDKEETPEIELADMPDGTYRGSAAGLNDDITVEITVDGGQVVAVEVVDHADTPDYFEQAKNVLDEIKSQQSLEVDTVSGATASSRGILNAIKDAMLNGFDEEA